MNKPELDYDVIIVGAGPTGVLAANLLGGYNVNTLILDREEDIVTIPRAVGICEEGSRILDAAGLMEGYDARCHTINAVHFVDKHQVSQFHADVDWRKDGHRAIRMFHQPDLERYMRKGLTRFPHVHLRPSTELEEFCDRGDHVSVRLNERGENRQVSCRFLLACDGASSNIRKSLGIGFSGQTYAQDWVILDIENNPIRDNAVAFSIDPQRPAVTMPGPQGRRRWEFVVKAEDDVDTLMSEGNLRRLIAPWGDMSAVKIARRAVYTFHARTAEHYRRGNVFLLGDAAHVTPPFAGQGMMAGLRDAYNLCWKIAAVLEGRIGASALDSYEQERIPQSKQIINFAQFVGSLVLPQRRRKARLRDTVFSFLRLLRVHSSTVGLPLRKLPNHINGSLLRHLLIQRIRKTGVELPQFELHTCCGMRVAADRLMGDQFRLVGWNFDPLDAMDNKTALRWQQAGGRVTTLASTENTLDAQELYLDRSQRYRDVFKGGRQVLVLRPDKMIALRCSPKKLNKQLNRYLDSLGCAQAA